MVRPIKEGQKREDDTKRSQKCAVKGPEEVRDQRSVDGIEGSEDARPWPEKATGGQ